jgi:crotonobetainyl-CoA:carnitine CoA-transferase CaiB-like acyl-CoA transferase
MELAQSTYLAAEAPPWTYDAARAARLRPHLARMLAALAALARISGFGQSGPFAGLPAYDIVVQAMSGLMDATGDDGGAPLKVGEAIGDLIAGLYAAWAIARRLGGSGPRHRHRGHARRRDVRRALCARCRPAHALHLLCRPDRCVARATGTAVHPLRRLSQRRRPRRRSPCSGERQFAALCEVIGRARGRRRPAPRPATRRAPPTSPRSAPCIEATPLRAQLPR